MVGPCEWCGGPQQWTIHDGEMLERCVSGCLPLFEVVVPPPDSDELERLREMSVAWNISEGGG